MPIMYCFIKNIFIALQRFNLISLIMDKCIIVTCWMNAAAYDSRKPVFERQLYVDSNLTFPYSQIESSLRVLYGDSCVIGFSSQMVK